MVGDKFLQSFGLEVLYNAGHLSPSFPSFRFLSFLCHLSREGFFVGATCAGLERTEPLLRSLAELGQADKAA